MLVLNNTPFVLACVYLQYFNSALPRIYPRETSLESQPRVQYHHTFKPSELPNNL